MPLEVIYGPKYEQKSIFEHLDVFVQKITDAYKQKKLQEWDNEWMTMALKDIGKASEQETTDALLSKINPPEDYLDMEGMKGFAENAVGMLQKDVSPETTPEGQKQFMPNKMEWNELYKFVSELPTGEVAWDNTLELFKKRLEQGRALGERATSFLNTILGQGVTDQRAKLEKDVNFTNYLMQTLYPEQADTVAEAWRRAEILPSERRIPFLKSYGIDIPEGETLDYDALNEFMQTNKLQIKNVTVNDKGQKSFSLEPIKGEYNLSEIMNMMEEAKEAGIKLSYSKDGFSMSLITEPTPEQPKLSTYATAKDIEADLKKNVENIDDFTRELRRLKARNPNINFTPFETTEYFADLMKDKYNESLSVLQYCAPYIEAGIEFDDKKELNYKETYREHWEKLNNYIEEYSRVTGIRLENPFIDLEEYETTDIKPWKLWAKSTWGLQHPPLKR